MAHECHPNQIKKQASKNTSSGRLDSLGNEHIPMARHFLKMMFLFRRWDMLVPWSVFSSFVDFPLFPQIIDVGTRMETVHTNIGLLSISCVKPAHLLPPPPAVGVFKVSGNNMCIGVLTDGRNHGNAHGSSVLLSFETVFFSKSTNMFKTSKVVNMWRVPILQFPKASSWGDFNHQLLGGSSHLVSG